MSDTTINYYNTHAQSYFNETIHADMSCMQSLFLNYLPKGCLLLDAGCGSGRDAKVFQQQGYLVTAIDASEQLCQLASEYLHQTVVCMSFQELETSNTFQGIWACASLLHVKKDALSDILKRFYRALRHNGILYVSVKKGIGFESIEGRFFQYYQANEMEDHLRQAGFQIIQTIETTDVRKEKQTIWINIIAKK